MHLFPQTIHDKDYGDEEAGAEQYVPVQIPADDCTEQCQA